jgi:hypothetical protein
MNDGFDNGGDGGEVIYVPQEVADAVIAFANAFSWDEKRRLVEEHGGELLGEYAELMIGVLIEQYAQQPDYHDSLTQDLHLLADCRRHGIAEAFARRARPDRARDLTPDVVRHLAELSDEAEALRFLSTHLGVQRLLLESIRSLVLADGPIAKRRVLERDRDLLLTVAAEVSLRETSGIDPAHESHADLIAVARAQGIDAALAWAYGETDQAPSADGPNPEIDEIIQELAHAERYMPPERRLELCRRGLELVSREDAEWGFFQWEIAQLLLQDHSAHRPAVLEDAIERYQVVLDWARARERHGAVAKIRAQLSKAYMERVRGDWDENRDESVRLAELAVAEAPEDDPDLLVFVHTYAAQARLARAFTEDLVTPMPAGRWSCSARTPGRSSAARSSTPWA